MIILGVDPGYSNLGLSIVDIKSKEVLFSHNYRVGVRDRPLLFPARVVTIIDGLFKDWNFEAIAYENPPFVRDLTTTALLWNVWGALAAWAAIHQFPFKGIAPKGIKWAAQDLLGELRQPRGKVPKKTVQKAVELWTGHKTPSTSNHEDDATLAAIALYDDQLPSRALE